MHTTTALVGALVGAAIVKLIDAGKEIKREKKTTHSVNYGLLDYAAANRERSRNRRTRA